MAEKQVIEIEAKTSGAESNIDKLTKAINDLAESTKKQEKANNEAAKSTKTLAKGLKFVGLSLKAIGVGLVIDAFNQLKEIFSQNQRVVDIFSTALEAFSIVVNQLVTGLFNVYDAVSKNSESFDGLKAVMSGLLTLAVTPLKLAFFAIKLSIQQAQLAWEQSFFGDKDPETIKTLTASITETQEAIISTGEDAVKAGASVVSNFGDMVGEVVEIGKKTADELGKISISSAIEQAKTNIELQKTAEIAAALNQGLIEKYDRQAEQQRQIRDEERNTLAVRKAANDALNDILDEQEKAMLKNAEAIVASAEAQFEKTKKDEDQIALIEAQNELLAVQAQVEGFRSEQKINDLALSREQNQLDKDAAITRLDNLRTEGEAEIELLNNKQLQIQATIDLEREQHEERLRLINERLEGEKEGSTAYAEILNERLTLDTEYGVKQKDLSKKLSDFNKDLKKKEEEAKLNIDGNAIGASMALAEKGSDTYKALAVAQVLLDTYRGIASAFASNSSNAGAVVATGGAWPFIQAAAAAAFGAANLKGILSVNPSGGGASAPSASVGSRASASVSGPQFNIQAAQQQNRLLNDISGTLGQPARAYVVASDITTAQQLDRNRINNASF